MGCRGEAVQKPQRWVVWHYCITYHTGTPSWKLKGVEFQLKGVALSGSYLPLNSYWSAFFFLAASGTYCGHLTSFHYFSMRFPYWNLSVIMSNPKVNYQKRGTISIYFNKLIKIEDACVCSNQHWEMVPLKINMKNSQYNSQSCFIFISH